MYVTRPYSAVLGGLRDTEVLTPGLMSPEVLEANIERHGLSRSRVLSDVDAKNQHAWSFRFWLPYILESKVNTRQRLFTATTLSHDRLARGVAILSSRSWSRGLEHD